MNTGAVHINIYVYDQIVHEVDVSLKVDRVSSVSFDRHNS